MDNDRRLSCIGCLYEDITYIYTNYDDYRYRSDIMA